MLFNLSDQNSIASVFLKDLRDKRNHTDRFKFRKNMERLGEILAYEISKKLTYQVEQVETPLKTTDAYSLQNIPVLIGILRAGIPFMQGFNNFFDQSDCGFIGAYREEGNDDIKINMEYAAIPTLKAREIIMVDPMLATGSSLIQALRNKVCPEGPLYVHIAAVISSPEGIENVINYFRSEASIPFKIWTCAIDEKLDSKFYIVPGLGDAGDLSFGEKVN